VSSTATSDRSTSPSTSEIRPDRLCTSTTDTRRRDLTLLVDERSETSGSFVARVCRDDCDASSCEEEDVLDQNAPVRHNLCLTHKSDANRRCDEFRGARPSN
jgi:hypothetical protein